MRTILTKLAFSGADELLHGWLRQLPSKGGPPPWLPARARRTARGAQHLFQPPPSTAHLLSRDFPDDEALVSLVEAEEALVTWVVTDDGRLAVVVRHIGSHNC